MSDSRSNGPSMNTSAEWTRIDDRRNKYVRQWHPESQSQGTFCIIHGLGEHGGRYDSFASTLATSGFRCVAFDQQGHGLSHEKRGCIESYKSMLEDIQAILYWIRTQEFAGPIILFGHSMGGNLVLNYALNDLEQPTAVISSSPMIRACRQPANWFIVIGRIIKAFMPNLQMKSEPKVEKLMSDPVEQAALRADELFHSSLSLRLGDALLKTGEWALKNANRLKVPLLLTHGTDDYLTSPEASREFADLAGEGCRFELLENHLHDPFRDEDREPVIKKFLQFANSFAGASG